MCLGLDRRRTHACRALGPVSTGPGPVFHRTRLPSLLSPDVLYTGMGEKLTLAASQGDPLPTLRRRHLLPKARGKVHPRASRWARAKERKVPNMLDQQPCWARD